TDLRGMSFPHLGIPEPLILYGKEQEDYEPNLQLLVDQGAELVVAVGFMMEPATRAVSSRNPNARFLLIDSPLLDASGKPTIAPNVRAVVFRENEGTFLSEDDGPRVRGVGGVGWKETTCGDHVTSYLVVFL